MIKLDISIKTVGLADGTYRVRAKGCIAAVLCWANSQGELPDWMPFAYVPITPNGEGQFRFTGHRAIPDEATHVLARAVRSDLTVTEEILQSLPIRHRQEPHQNAVLFGVITDLHLSGKPWTVQKALHMVGEDNAVLCVGDMVNDGLPEQFALLRESIEQVLPENTPMLAVTGNHDYPLFPIPQVVDGVCDYPTLQNWLLNRAERTGLSYELDESGAYAVKLDGIDIVGLNVASHWRKMAFQKNSQLSWLERHLETVSASWHVVLCHAPLLNHNPQRLKANMPPYFSRDGHLKQIMEDHRNMIIVSGHTHISFNSIHGCVDIDSVRNNLYINCGSIRPTTLKPDEVLQPKEWTNGNVVRLELSEKQAEIAAISIESGQRISRGYYRYIKES